MSKYFIVCLIFLLAGFSFSYGQDKKNPVSYRNVQWSGHLAQFNFDDLGEREILARKKMTFYAPEKVEMKFRVKIRPDGTVSYVAPARCNHNMDEYRKGGTSALYGYRFSKTDGEKDQWVRVKMVVGE